ncbi:MAG: glycosyltransferase, partial [Bacilli bacterium]
MKKKLLVLCTTDSMIWNFLIPHIKEWELKYDVECACSNTGFYFNELKEIYNLNVIEIPFSRNPIKIKNIKSFFNLSKLTKLKKYDLIICQEPVGGLMGRLVAINKGIKVIYTAHGFHFYKGAAIKNWLLYYPIERILAHFTDVLITSNQEDFELAQKFKAKKIKKINGVGINLEKFNNESSVEIKIKLKKELNIPLNSKVILNAAELIERKNHKIALETFAQLPENSRYFVIC